MGVIADRMATMGTENAFKIGEDIIRAQKRGVDVLRFTIGEPDFDSAPNILKGNTHYTDPAGILSLREATANHVRRTRGIDVVADQVIVLPAANPGISYAMMSYVNPGDEVIYPSPGFPIYESWITYMGGTPVPLILREEQGFAFTPTELEKVMTKRTKVLILCSPSNPTGGVLTRDVMEGIADVVRMKASPDLRIFSDEIYEHITFDGFEHVSIASMPDMQERTVICSGHSKGFAMTGWRLGWAVLPSVEEAALWKQININYVSCVPPFIQEAAREAFQSPKTPAVVDRMVATFKERRDYVVPALNDIPGVHCNKPLGAFYVFPNVNGLCENLGIHHFYTNLVDAQQAKTSPATLLTRFLLYVHGVALVDRRSFGVRQSEGQHFVRLSIAAAMDSLKEGIQRIIAASNNTAGFKEFTKDQEALGVSS